MKTAQRRRRRLSALLVVPLLVVLSGCVKFHMDIDIRSEDDAVMTMEIVDKLGFLELAEEGCDEFSDDVNDAKVEQFTDDEGNFGCRISGNVGGVVDEDGFWITQEGNELVFKLFNLDAGLEDDDLGLDDDEIDFDDPMMQMFAPDIKVSVTFPGKVTYASPGGEIDGKTVTWTGMEVFSLDIEARGEAKGGFFGGGGSSDSDDTEDATTGGDSEDDKAESDDAQSDDKEDSATDDEESDGDDVATTPTEKPADSEKSGLPLWVVGLLGLLLLLVIFLIIKVARGGKKDDGGDAGQFPPQQYQQQPQQFQQQYPPQQYQQQYPPQQPGQYPPQQGQYPGQQQWDQTQQMPQEWGQTQQFPQQGQPGQWNDGSQPPTQ